MSVVCLLSIWRHHPGICASVICFAGLPVCSAHPQYQSLADVCFLRAAWFYFLFRYERVCRQKRGLRQDRDLGSLTCNLGSRGVEHVRFISCFWFNWRISVVLQHKAGGLRAHYCTALREY